MPNDSMNSSFANNMSYSSTTAASANTRTASPDRINESGRSTPDATKRVRVKRSKPNLSARTPLLEGGGEDGHRAIDVHLEVTMPLPMMYVNLHLS